MRRHERALVGVACALVATSILSMASAQPSSDWTFCTGKDGATPSTPDRQLKSCTTIIQSGQDTSTNIAVAYNNRGNAYNWKGQHNRALADYEQAIRLNPNYSLAFYNRGRTYFAKRQYARAILDLDQAIRLGSNSLRDKVLAFIMRGRTHYEQHAYDLAIQDFDAAIRLYQNNPMALVNRGLAYEKLGRKKTAIADYQEALRISPNYRPAAEALRKLESQ